MPDLNEVAFKLENSAAGKQWKAIGIKHHHGINLPLFSLHSAQSCGIGEFNDLLPIIDWCGNLGLDVIQLLPLNDTGNEASPYSLQSAFALNSIHLSLASLPSMSRYPELEKQIGELQKNDSPIVRYEQVRKEKDKILQAYFHEEFTKVEAAPEYRDFIAKNPWVEGYALYKVLKEIYQESSWETWNEKHRDPSSDVLRDLYAEYRSKMNYHIFVQYFCFKQMHGVKEYATSKAVYIKGDIPILINRDSADVWLHRNYFYLQFSAGAPPDMYNHEGQNWGFPPYNWHEMNRDNDSWWRMRLKVAEEYYHIYRIDHIVGFFRIWIVPPGAMGKEGKFLPQNEQEWIPAGKKIMQLKLNESSMLPIGEDLGTVHLEIRACLKELGICGTKVIRWERYYDGDRTFIKYEDYPPISMTTVSTHDSETLQQWWQKCTNEVKDFCAFKGWEYTDKLLFDRHRAILWDSHHTASLFHINLLQEYLAVIPGMTGDDLEAERVNVPGIVSDRNWCYKFKPSVEEIVSSVPLRELFQSLF